MRDGLPAQPLYRVRFRQKEVWPDYRGNERRRARGRDISALAGNGMSDQGKYRPLSYFQLMEISLRELLVEKGILTDEQVDAAVEDMRNRTPERGAKVVARAWVDAGFRKRLLENGTKACEELGLDVPALKLLAVENTPQVHNAIVCTLCSCYPRMLLGIPPEWYKSRNYRSRMVREPRAVLAEFGLHDSREDCRFACTTPPPTCATSCCRCAPPAPRAGARSGSPRWSTATRMIGVAVPKGPND